MTTKELEARTGLSISAKCVFVLAGPDLFRKVDGAWEAYPPYPEVVSEGDGA